MIAADALEPIPGGLSREVTNWEARFAGAMAVFVADFIASDPTPPGSTWHREVASWIESLLVRASSGDTTHAGREASDVERAWHYVLRAYVEAAGMLPTGHGDRALMARQARRVARILGVRPLGVAA